KSIYFILAFEKSACDGHYAEALNTAFWRDLACYQFISVGWVIKLTHASRICRTTLTGRA
ncbi:TPA: hypothetical protein ACIV0P_004490, partial [Salmonella enterica subsp. diarizonae serovar 61:z52-z57:-]